MKLITKKLAIVFSLSMCTFVALSSNVMAKDSSSGCGMGWQVFKKNSLVSSALRATTNATFLNTLAMTTGTSGCAKHSIVLNAKEGIQFVEVNEKHLQLDLAKGQGEYLAGIAQIMGCSNLDALGSGLQNNFQAIYHQVDLSPAQVYGNIQRSVLSNANLRNACGII